MSHFTKITAEIKDLEALSVAVRKMGFSISKNADCRYYYGAEKKDIVINLPGKYDIAATESEGHYNLEADFWQDHVSKYVGANGDLLMQQYSVEKTRIEAFKNGLGVTEKSEHGVTTLTLIDPDSGGQIFVDCYPGGRTEVKTTGFQGSSCMRFRSIEQALGATDSFSHTDEFYLAEPETAVEEVHTDY